MRLYDIVILRRCKNGPENNWEFYSRMQKEKTTYAGIIISITFTGAVANTDIEKICTFLVGAFVWGYGIWMRIKLRKVLKDIDG